jgi:BACON domain-containing protein
MPGPARRTSLAILSCFAFGCAPVVAYPVRYTLDAMFGNVINGGPDLLHLAGKPFRIAGFIDSASPSNPGSCAGVCVYNNQHLMLTVGSLVDMPLDEVPVTFQSGTPGLISISGKVVFVPLSAVIRLRLSASVPYAFGTQTISAASSTVTYGRSINTTVLSLASGTMSATTTAPALSAEPSTLSFSVRRGVASPSVQVRITTASPVNFSAAASANWLRVTSSSTSTGEAGAVLTVSIDPGKLPSVPPPANLNAIVVTSTQAANSPLTIPVAISYSSRRRRATRP